MSALKSSSCHGRKSAAYGGFVGGLEPGRSGMESPAWHADALRETSERVARGEEKIFDWEQAKKKLRKGGMNLRVLTSAFNDLADGRDFYERQGAGLGNIFSIHSFRT